jgi:hypothetical protein
MPWLSSGLLALQHSKKLECDTKSITIYESFINLTSMVQADKSVLLLYSGNNSSVATSLAQAEQATEPSCHFGCMGQLTCE